MSQIPPNPLLTPPRAPHAVALDVLPEDGTVQGSRFAKAHHILLYFILAVVAIWVLSGFYQVGSTQVAIVERLGQYLQTTEGQIDRVEHGLHYHLPWPIDRVSLISTSQKFTLKVNAFNASPTEYEGFKRDLLKKGANPTIINALFDPYVITADKSILNIEVNVSFVISDPGAWLTSVSHEYQPTYAASVDNDMRNAMFQQIAQRTIIAQVARMP